MNTDALTFCGGEAVQHSVVQRDKSIQQSATWIEFERQPSLGEVYLHTRGARVQTFTNVADRFLNKIFQKHLLRIPGQPTLRIEQTQRRRRDYCLLQWPVSILLRSFEVGRGMNAIAERPCRKPR